MEPENEPIVQSEGQVSPFRVTPLSKYLLMVSFVLVVFIGVWIAYTFAPEKTELESEILNASTSTERKMLSRFELFENELTLAKKFGIDTSDPLLGTAKLYWAKDPAVEDTLILYKDRGISLRLPYNEGIGWPYYSLTPYDVKDDVLFYGSINPCPAGCMGSRGMIMGVIKFHPVGTKDVLIAEFNDQEGDYGVCKEVRVNASVSGTYCRGDGGLSPELFIIEGSKYTYELSGRCASYAAGENPSERYCGEIRESMLVE